MSRFDPQRLFQKLKEELKKKKITYQELGGRINLSEPAIKHMFSVNNATLDRLVEICNVADLHFPDLIAQTQFDTQTNFTFTEKQEEFFARNPNYYYFFREILFEKKSVADLEKERKLSRKSIAKYLRKLESMDLLEWHPQDRIKFKVYGKLKWADHGPWMRGQLPGFYSEMMELLKSHPDNQDFYTSFVGHFKVPRHVFEMFKAEIQDIQEKYREIAFRKDMLDASEKKKFIPVSWLFNIIPVDLYAHRTYIPELNGPIIEVPCTKTKK
jgi:transcriptional regulator with XRE-family HTH domain